MPSIMPWTGCPALCRRAAQQQPTLSATEEGDDCEYQEYEEQYFRDAGRARGNAAEAENRGHDGDDEKDDCVVKHCCLPPPAIFALALWAALFLSGLLLRYRRRPPLTVGRVRRVHTADMSLLFISRHPLLCCD
jgi:hypothetical protein